MAKLFSFISFLFFSTCFFSQERSLLIKKASSDIEINGDLTELPWKNAIKANDFHQVYPSDSVMAVAKTEVMVCFDDQNIYVAAICYDDFMDKNYQQTKGSSAISNISLSDESESNPEDDQQAPEAKEGVTKQQNQASNKK